VRMAFCLRLCDHTQHFSQQ